MSPDITHKNFGDQLSLILLFGTVGMFTEIFVRTHPGTNPVFAHTIKDAFYAAGAATIFLKPKESLVMPALIGFGILSAAEVGQLVLQSLHVIDRGFSDLDFLAYAIGAFALFPLIHYSAKYLHNSRK